MYEQAVNIIGFLGFTGAVIALSFVPSAPTGRFTSPTKAFMIAAYGVYVLSLGVESFGIGAAVPILEELENFVEVLFPIFVLMAVISAYSAQQMMDLRSAQRSMKASHDMVFGILETAPAGILVLDTGGHITFANETARTVLDLAEDPSTGDIVTPGWTVTDREGKGRPDFRVLAEQPGHLGRKSLVVRWPSGWHVNLDVYAEPLGTGDGQSGGLVATFERPRLDPRT